MNNTKHSNILDKDKVNAEGAKVQRSRIFIFSGLFIVVLVCVILLGALITIGHFLKEFSQPW